MTDPITIPAADIKPGDVLHIEWTVDRVVTGRRTQIDFPQVGGSEQSRPRLFVDYDDLLTVTRPDPDADLIERIAAAIAESDDPGCDAWAKLDDEHSKNIYRVNARAALAVMRGEA